MEDNGDARQELQSCLTNWALPLVHLEAAFRLQGAVAVQDGEGLTLQLALGLLVRGRVRQLGDGDEEQSGDAGEVHSGWCCGVGLVKEVRK